MSPMFTAQFTVDVDYRFTWADDAFASIVGVSAALIQGRRAIDFVAMGSRVAVTQIAAAVRDGQVPAASTTCGFRRSDGSTFSVTLVLSPIYDGSEGAICTLISDVAPDSDEAAARIAEAARNLARRESLLGRREELAGQREALLGDWERFLAERERALHTRDLSADTGPRHAAAGPAPRTPAQDLVVAPAGQVPGHSPTRRANRPSARHPRAARLTQRPDRHPGVFQQDTLTGLDTRALLLAELARIEPSSNGLSVLLVDLDDFKSINDTYGHEIGDEVLIFVAETLRDSVRPSDLIVRFGGDEFVILCADRDAATTVAKRIVDHLAMPVETSAGLISITASVGIGDATIPADGAGDLLGRADAAMYWAKRLGKNRFFIYDEDLHARVAEDRRIENLLRSAIDDGRLILHYQPIVDVSGHIMGVEAVTRLLDEAGRMLMPDQFLPVAARVGILAECDSWVLTQACRTAADLREMTGEPLAVSVNISQQLLEHPGFFARVQQSLIETELPACALMLEISETTLLAVDAGTRSKLSDLRDHGMAIAIDGFGLGYSPLSFLRELPLTHVKMSRPCIASMLGDERDAAMIEALTWLVDQLGLKWVAEGIETDDQWQAIRQYGPGYGQGFLFAEPLTEPQLIQVLTADGIGTSPDAASVLS